MSDRPEWPRLNVRAAPRNFGKFYGLQSELFEKLNRLARDAYSDQSERPSEGYAEFVTVLKAFTDEFARLRRGAAQP